MKIGINGQGLFIRNPAGPEKYLINLIRSLSKIDYINEYIVYTDQTPPKQELEELVGANTNFHFKPINSKISWTQKALALELLKNPVDVFFTSTHTLPIVKRPFSKNVCMIHGLEYEYAKSQANTLKRLFLSKPEWFSTTFSTKIIAPSIATKEAILEKWSLWVPENKISVVREGVDEKFKPFSERDSQTALKRYGLEYKKYLIFVSTIQPRKNLPNLINGLSILLEEKPELKSLKLLVCGKNGWDYEESLNAPKHFAVEKNILFAGRVPDEELPSLLAGAAVYVNGSFEEGFGLPLLEAMASGTTPVVSNILAHRELAGENAFYFDPYNPKDIKNTLEKAIFTEPKKLEKMAKSALEEASKLSWEKTAQETLRILTS